MTFIIVDFGHLSIDDLLSYYYVKPFGARYMLYKQSHKKQVYVFPHKTNYLDTVDYEVSGNYTTGAYDSLI